MESKVAQICNQFLQNKSPYFLEKRGYIIVAFYVPIRLKCISIQRKCPVQERFPYIFSRKPKLCRMKKTKKRMCTSDNILKV